MAPISMTSFRTLAAQRFGRFSRSWGPPHLMREASEQEVRAERYDRLWDLAVGNAYTDRRRWGNYRRTHGLYRQTRCVIDYAHFAVAFWASRVWAGSLAEDGMTLPDGQKNAVPFAKDIRPETAACCAQIFRWTNFQVLMTQIPYYTAALGETLVEIVDDDGRGNIVWDIIWPGWVKEVNLDEAGNIIDYHLSYDAYDRAAKQDYRYGKIVTKDTISTFRNEQPYGYDGNPAVYDNPYGFIPARWFRHYPMLGNRGEPAIYAAQSELDEVNSMMSHLLDKVHVNLEAPMIVAGNLNPNSLSRIAPAKRMSTEELDDPGRSAEDWNVFEAPQGTEIKTVTVQTAETIAAIKEVTASLERKLPEVQYLMALRDMTQVTGSAPSRLSSDVDFRYKSVCAGHDRNLGAMLEMSIAIGGWRANNGDWDGTQAPDGLTAAQELFLEFDLDSYAAGELSVIIMPRDLVPETAVDRMNLLQAKRNALKLLDTPTGAKMLLAEAGYSEEVAEELAQEAEEMEAERIQQEQDRMKMELDARTARTNANPRGGAPNKPGRPPVGQGVK